MVTCPRCGTENRPGTAICDECGLVLVENSIATHVIDESPVGRNVDWGTHTFGSGTDLLLHIGEDRTTLQVALSSQKELIFGRWSPDFTPDVDLTAYSGQERGVSRKHARIMLIDDKLYIEDLGSANGTFINEGRLSSGERRMLSDGSEVFFGRLKVQFYY